MASAPLLRNHSSGRLPHGRKPTHDLDALSITHNPPGAQKEKIRERATAVPLWCEYDHTGTVHEKWGRTYREKPEPEAPKRRPSSRKPPRPYAELRTASAFSLLDNSSLPEDLIGRAAELDLPAVALVDTNGVYGAPRFYGAAKKAGVRALVGAELVMEDGAAGGAGAPLRTTVLVENRAGFTSEDPNAALWEQVAAASERRRRERRSSLRCAPHDGMKEGWRTTRGSGTIA